MENGEGGRPLHVPGGTRRSLDTSAASPTPTGIAMSSLPSAESRFFHQPGRRCGSRNTGSVLYPWLRQNRGVAFSHSTATGQGTDWRDNDPELEPLMEIYQGYHANYEYAGAPLAETDEYQSSVHGAYQPLGMYWNALAKGYKLGVESSSDHISTHSSYTMIYSPSPTRQISWTACTTPRVHRHGQHRSGCSRARRARPGMDDGRHSGSHGVSSLPREHRRTAPIQSIDLIKNGKFVYRAEPH